MLFFALLILSLPLRITWSLTLTSEDKQLDMPAEQGQRG